MLAYNKASILIRVIASLGLGFIWALAYPTWNMTGFAWVAPAGLLAMSAGHKSWQVFGWGFLVSWTHSATSLYWLLNMPHLPAAIAGWLSLSAYVACYPALWAWMVWRLISYYRLQTNPVQPPSAVEWIRSLTFIQAQWMALWGAALWVGLELTVSHLLTGFPWLLIGATQLPWTPLAQAAALGGVYLISFVLVWASVSMGIGVTRMQISRPCPWRWMPDVALPAGVILLLSLYGYQRIQTV